MINAKSLEAVHTHTHTHTHTDSLENKKGITLVALVVTIVVLLILAGVSINLVLGENGLITKAQEAKRKTKEATTNEMTDINKMNNELEQYSLEGGNWNEKLGICTPKLGNNMVGVYWSDGTKNKSGLYIASATASDIEVTSDEPEFCWSEWYNYVAGDNSIDSKTSRWANAKSLTDGSYFVWIPRYEYKILSGEHTSTAGKIDVQFINMDTTTADKEGYKVHHAFTTNLELGGWDSEISGIWVAKYEMSMEQTTDGGSTWSNVKPTNKNKKISASVRAVSKPNKYSWTLLNTSSCFYNALNYSNLQKTGENSHLMKNSEWGAVAYLAHSQYGRNSNKIGMNTSDTYSSNTTGFGGEDLNVSAEIKAENLYNGMYGMNASSTGNLYGIYDLNGGKWEHVAGTYGRYLTDYLEELYINIGLKNYSLNTIVDYLKPQQSTKFVTIYPTNKDESRQYDSIDCNYSIWNNIYGDAMYETSEKNGYSGAWNGNFSDEDSITSEKYEFSIIRGGSYQEKSGAGLFAFADGDDPWWNASYRVVLVCE